MNDLTSRLYLLDAINKLSERKASNHLQDLPTSPLLVHKIPPAPPETCEGCKHLGKWENKVEYGYPSPCTHCKRMVDDHYER